MEIKPIIEKNTLNYLCNSMIGRYNHKHIKRHDCPKYSRECVICSDWCVSAFTSLFSCRCLQQNLLVYVAVTACNPARGFFESFPLLFHYGCSIIQYHTIPCSLDKILFVWIMQVKRYLPKYCNSLYHWILKKKLNH